MHRFLVVIENGENNYSAYSPDLPAAWQPERLGKMQNEPCTRLSKCMCVGYKKIICQSQNPIHLQNTLLFLKTGSVAKPCSCSPHDQNVPGYQLRFYCNGSMTRAVRDSPTTPPHLTRQCKGETGRRARSTAAPVTAWSLILATQ